MLLQLFADRLAEALSVWQYNKVKNEWGVENMIRPAVGYSSLPNHNLKRDLLEILENKINITLTETGAMIPVSSVCGLYISNSQAKYF
jgi:5-methyltetrahydrofolate--homocysteine methyltransferase